MTISDALLSAANGTGVSPQDTLDLLDDVMNHPGAQAYHYTVVRRMLDENRSINNYSLQQLQKITGKAATTCKMIKKWIPLHISWGPTPNSNGHDVAPCQIPDQTTVRDSVPSVATAPSNIHGEAERLTRELARIGWGRKNGRQMQDPTAFVNTHGVEQVREALRRAGLPEVKNPAAYVTWFLRTHSLTALPIQAPARPPATDAALGPVLRCVQMQIRPQAWQCWFQDCRLTCSAKTITAWLPNPYAPDGVKAQFHSLLDEAVETTIGTGYRLDFQVCP